MSLRLEGVDTLKYRCVCRTPSEKFNIVINDHGRTQKYSCCVPIGKTNFTDRDKPNTINGFKDLVLVCKMRDCYCTIRKNFEHFHQAAGDCNEYTSHMKTNHFKMYLNVFSTTHTYSNCIVYRLFYC